MNITLIQDLNPYETWNGDLPRDITKDRLYRSIAQTMYGNPITPITLTHLKASGKRDKTTILSTLIKEKKEQIIHSTLLQDTSSKITYTRIVPSEESHTFEKDDVINVESKSFIPNRRGHLEGGSKSRKCRSSRRKSSRRRSSRRR